MRVTMVMLWTLLGSTGIHEPTATTHTARGGSCKVTEVVVPGDADELMQYIENGQLGILWQRDSAGPVDQAAYDAADTY